MISQKCQYAIRTMFELARRAGSPAPVQAKDIAAAQAIPLRFLKVILGQLRNAGLVSARRGRDGGYTLARPPAAITVGELIRVVQGPLLMVDCPPGGDRDCALAGRCVFRDMWRRAETAVDAVFDGTTLKTLVDADRARAAKSGGIYDI